MVITDLIPDLRYKIGDIGTTPVFSDAELTKELNYALQKYNPTRAFADLQTFEHILVIKLAWISLCYVLAADFAKYHQISITGLSIEKTTPFRNYLELAQYLEKQVQEEVDKSGVDSVISGMGTITTGLLTRESLETRTVVPYEANVPPTKLALYATNLAHLSVKLNWTIAYTTDFQKYVLYRSQVAGTKGNLIKEEWDNHVGFFNDVLTATGDYWYTLDILDTSDLSTSSDQIKVTIP
jgi:hypothetical protein